MQMNQSESGKGEGEQAEQTIIRDILLKSGVRRL